MQNKTELCEKIKEIYPEIGECGGDVDVHFDNDKKAFAVKLTRGKKSLTTYLEQEDTNACLENERCLSLGVQVSQLIDNVENV